MTAPERLPPTPPLGERSRRIADPDGWFAGRGERCTARSLKDGAPYYQLSDAARVAVETALALGEPLLVTGEPGTGKTQLAYYLAYALDVEPVFHFQVQSTTTARDLRYHFDELRRFHEGKDRPRREFLEKRALWEARDRALETGRPPVLLIDEVDKAPRDFPNDLLRDLDTFEWAVPELGGEAVTFPEEARDLRPVVVITSNEERELPRPFVRRCLFCHLPFDKGVLARALAARRHELGDPDEGFIDMLVTRFMEIRDLTRRHTPATGEALTWARALRLYERGAADLAGPLGEVPLLEAAVKHPEDLKSIRKSG